MENIMKFAKKHSVLLLSIACGVLLLIVVCSSAFGRHRSDFRMQKNAMRNPMMWKNWPMMWWAGMSPMAWGPREERMQERMCQSGSLQSGAAEHLLVSLDMKINNLELIKKNMQSMAQRAATEYPTGDAQSLDDLIQRFDAQRKLLETAPGSFCAETDTWKALNEDMRKVIMEGISGQVSKLREKGKGMGMMNFIR